MTLTLELISSPMQLTLIPLQFASLFNLPAWSVAVIVPVAGMVFGGVMAISAMYFKNRERQLWHETARIALEKGQPLPVSDDAPECGRPGASRRPAHRDLRAGLVLLGLGAGLFLFLQSVDDGKAAYVGAIPGFIGVSLLLYYFITAIFSPKQATPTSTRS
jgi:hypothetical protein